MPSANPYVYAGDDPVNLVDPSGTISTTCFLSILGIVGAIVAAVTLVTFFVTIGPGSIIPLVLGILANAGTSVYVGIIVSWGAAISVVFQVLTFVVGIVSLANIQQSCSS